MWQWGLFFLDDCKKGFVCFFLHCINLCCSSLVLYDFDLHILTSLPTPRCINLRRVFILYLATKAAIYTCVETLKFVLCCHFGQTIFFFFFSLIACFTLNRAGPPAGFYSTFNRATFGGNLPQSPLGVQNKSMWNKGGLWMRKDDTAIPVPQPPSMRH